MRSRKTSMERQSNCTRGSAVRPPCIACPLVLPVVFLLSLTLAAAPAPRCKVEGSYQAALLIFSCDGASGLPQNNQVQTLIPARASWTQTVPKATRNLFVTADSPTDISLALMDPLTLTAVKSPSYKGVPYRTTGSSGTQPHKEIRLSGTSPNDLVLKVTNNAGIATVVKIGYVYDYYTSANKSRQCREGQQAVGCSGYDQAAVRAAVSDWSCWLRKTFNNSASAWTSLAGPWVVGLGVPVYSWCNVWQKWKAAPRSIDCLAAYKFVTQGGRELGVQSVYQPNFEWAWKACLLQDFTRLCCMRISNRKRQAGGIIGAWKQWTSAGQQTLPTSKSGPWDTCADLRPAGVYKEDFFKFLDADGYGGVRLSDIQAACYPYRSVSSMSPKKGLGNASSRMALPYSPAMTTTTKKKGFSLGKILANGLGSRSWRALTKPQSALPALPKVKTKAQSALPALPKVNTSQPAAKTFGALAKGPKVSSIVTSVAGGLAVAAAAATGIALTVQNSKLQTLQQRAASRRRKRKNSKRSRGPASPNDKSSDDAGGWWNQMLKPRAKAKRPRVAAKKSAGSNTAGAVSSPKVTSVVGTLRLSVSDACAALRHAASFKAALGRSIASVIDGVSSKMVKVTKLTAKGCNARRLANASQLISQLTAAFKIVLPQKQANAAAASSVSTQQLAGTVVKTLSSTQAAFSQKLKVAIGAEVKKANIPVTVQTLAVIKPTVTTRVVTVPASIMPFAPVVMMVVAGLLGIFLVHWLCVMRASTDEEEYEDDENEEEEEDCEQVPLLTAERELQRSYPETLVQQPPPLPQVMNFQQEFRQPEVRQEPGVYMQQVPTFGPIPGMAPGVSMAPQQAFQAPMEMQRPFMLKGPQRPQTSMAN